MAAFCKSVEIWQNYHQCQSGCVFWKRVGKRESMKQRQLKRLRQWQKYTNKHKKFGSWLSGKSLKYCHHMSHFKTTESRERNGWKIAATMTRESSKTVQKHCLVTNFSGYIGHATIVNLFSWMLTTACRFCSWVRVKVRVRFRFSVMVGQGRGNNTFCPTDIS